jgi:hypothetical protein
MPKPSRLYKYEPFSPQALENLKNQVIYFGSPLQFNDPYDCALTPSIKEPTDAEVEKIRAHYLSNEAMDDQRRRSFKTMSTPGLRVMLLGIGQTVLEDAIKEFTSRRGVSCFGESPENLLMWSHYGSHHRGFCLEFRADLEPFGKIRQVKYSDQMPEFDLVTMLCDREFDQVLDLYCTKALDWQYEREWRCIHNQSGTAFTYETEALTGVYFGARATFTSFEIAALILAGQNERVKLWHGKRSKSDFAVTFDQVTYTSHLAAKRLLGESQ